MKKQAVSFLIGLMIFILATALLIFIPQLAILYFPIMLALFTALMISDNKKSALSLFVISAAALFVLFQTFALPALLALLPIFASFVLNRQIKASASQKQVLLTFSVASALFFAGFILTATGFSADSLNIYFNAAKEILYDNAEILTQQGIFDSALKDDFIAMSSVLLEQLKLMFPSTLIIISAISGYISMQFASVFGKLFKSETAFTPHFSEFKCSRITTTLAFVSALCMIFISEGVLYVTFRNIFAVFSFLLCASAASLVDFILKKKNWAFIVRVIIAAIIVSNYQGSFLSWITLAVAMMDARADFRRLDTVNENE